MNKLTTLLVCTMFVVGQASADSFEAEVKPMLEASCLLCHGEGTVTPLNMQELSYDLGDAEVYRTWQHIYNRIERGQMPPMEVSDTVQSLIDNALTALKPALVDANIASRGGSRAELRRLTQLEYAYSLQDLLHLDAETATALASELPAAADTGGFNTVAKNQDISALHVRGYLRAADRALDAAIQLGPRPESERFEIEYRKSGYLYTLSTQEVFGLGVTKLLDDGVATFFDAVSTYAFYTESEGYNVPSPGRYRVTLDAYPYQADSPVILTLYSGKKQGIVASLDNLIGSFDLVEPEGRVVEVTTYLEPGMLVGPSLADVDLRGENPGIYYLPENFVTDYRGEGIAMKSMVIEGPLNDVWPPASTNKLLTGIDFDESGQIELSKPAMDHINEIVETFAQRAFRRPLAEGEAKLYADMAIPLLEDGRPFLEALRVPLRTVLNSPSFLYQDGASGVLDDYSLASRLSYFLWRSMPDDALLAVAEAGRLSEPAELARQVERMLDDPKSKRFVKDFVGQAYRLYEINSTSPDTGLYPEFNDLLGQAMVAESELFYEELIRENLSLTNLVRADFTFLNRRLAEHYRVPGIEGQQMRKVMLPEGSVRGGLLSQSSIHKITANGTTTSPIPRGNFVLANLLGRPAPPPPPNVGGVEPDTRGTTTIREQLAAHRDSTICAGCHKTIDPPGFALESFDPIGGFRDQYRAVGDFSEILQYAPYQLGLPVDASGITSDGASFRGFADYQQVLLDTEMDAISYNLADQLITFSTGAQVEFSDRDAVNEILSLTKDQNYPLRTMIHEVVASDLFRTR
ncbi:MAG: DUF1592 domain-containing protein [Pseudohongiellaceae bacterium]|uniref:Cytochrome c domain-containing protein n=1 Tax=OM182 bacterium MED-G28 TaxID=1986256 RepID=A0A2A5WAH1_9GAMM|nr:MAG: hypothetical protein CNF02_09240 [OM182 bacterium MED-G28]